MTDYKALIESLLTDVESGAAKADEEEFKTFCSGLIDNYEFQKMFLNVMVESAQKTAGIMMNSDGKEDAIKMIQIASVNRPIMQLAYITFMLGQRSEQAKAMDKFFPHLTQLFSRDTMEERC